MIAGALDNQIAGIRAQLDQATALRAEAEAIKAEYQAKAKQAAIDAEAMKAAAEEEAKLIVSRAKSDATALIGRRAQAAEEKLPPPNALRLAMCVRLRPRLLLLPLRNLSLRIMTQRPMPR